MEAAFREGQRCRVKHDYSHLNHVFRAGEEVVFKSYSYSPKEGVARYWFQNVASGETNAWHAFDYATRESDLHAIFETIDDA